MYARVSKLNSLESPIKISLKTITLGATPNVTKSARLSNCLPNSPLTLSNRAKKPSKKSKKAPLKMQIEAKNNSLE